MLHPLYRLKVQAVQCGADIEIVDQRVDVFRIRAIGSSACVFT